MVRPLVLVFFAVFSTACASDWDLPGAEPAPLPGEAAVLELLNDPSTTHGLLDLEVGVDRRAASRLIGHRNGPDGLYGTADDNLFGSLLEVEVLPNVGPDCIGRLRAYAEANGYGG